MRLLLARHHFLGLQFSEALLRPCLRGCLVRHDLIDLGDFLRVLLCSLGSDAGGDPGLQVERETVVLAQRRYAYPRCLRGEKVCSGLEGSCSEDGAERGCLLVAYREKVARYGPASSRRSYCFCCCTTGDAPSGVDNLHYKKSNDDIKTGRGGCR